VNRLGANKEDMHVRFPQEVTRDARFIARDRQRMVGGRKENFFYWWSTIKFKKTC